MLDLNNSPPLLEVPSSSHIHKPVKAAESSLTMEIAYSECDEAGSVGATTHRHSDEQFAPRLKELISTEHSSITASSGLSSKTFNDPALLVECEASSKHVNPHVSEVIFENRLFKHSNNLHLAKHDAYGLSNSNGHKPPDRGPYFLDASDCRLSLDDYKFSLEGNSSSNIEKASLMQSPGSVVSSDTGMAEERRFAHHFKEHSLAYESRGVPSMENARATHQHSVEADEPTMTQQLFPLRPSFREDGDERPSSNMLDHSSIQPMVTNLNCFFQGATSTSKHPPNVNHNSVISNSSLCKGGVAASNVLLTNGLINTSLDHMGASTTALSPWMGFSFSSNTQAASLPMMSHLSPIVSGIQPVKKSRRGPRSRSSQYRGVTFYRRTGRWESHIWDCGKQVYLGGFDTAHAAARAYDRAAIRFRGLDADINFQLGDYESEINQMNTVSKEEFVHLLRRQSMGFSRGSSRYRGVTLHKCGRWEARMGQLLGKKAYDEAAIQCNGREAVTNFDPRLYNKKLPNESVSNVAGDDLELSLGTSLHRQQSLQRQDVKSLNMLHHPNGNPMTRVQDSKSSVSSWWKQQGDLEQVGDDNQHSSLLHMRSSVILEGKVSPIARKRIIGNEVTSGFKPFKSTREALGDQHVAMKGMAPSPIKHLEPPPLPSPPLAASGGWAWQVQQNACAAAAAALSSAPPSSAVHAHASALMHVAAASSGFSPQLIKQHHQGQEEGYAFPQWLHKTGFSYLSVPSLADS
ncbi:hypothetical protein GOP47_0002089 [Adiantum capillus-veneris]|uniref:AP2/ERF domain-containing protein n=1 Tax=Adiantum capillus-veneris TaxID=13818 RepID=A0A9D4ZQP1_ADICA|nr:hypothetical protein GOP47_0002089 [Adiantum capillus-veneris]